MLRPEESSRGRQPRYLGGDVILAEVCERGFDPELGSLVQAYGSKRLDANLLLLGLVGFLPAKDPRVEGTLRAIAAKLLVDGEFVLRYEPANTSDGVPQGEGAFLVAACGSTTTSCRAGTEAARLFA